MFICRPESSIFVQQGLVLLNRPRFVKLEGKCTLSFDIAVGYHIVANEFDFRGDLKFVVRI